MTREWTNLSGKKLTAEYMGHKGSDVVLKLTNGKLFFLPAVKLASDDLDFLKEHHFIYLPIWQGWPSDAGGGLAQINVSEEQTDPHTYFYTTENFQFKCNVKLGPILMKDIALVFEQTYHLHSRSPFGILANPENGHFEAHLMASREAYMKLGGPDNSAGVYKPKEKIFLAPLELMGMKQSSAGWRKDSKEYDPSTIVHELTHMLTHEMLDHLPIWINEGYAEYISNIPIKNRVFQLERNAIREGIRDLYYRDHVMASTGRNTAAVKASQAEKKAFLESPEFPLMVPVHEILTLTDRAWASRATTTRFAPRYGGMVGLYRTSHLIFYYFMEIEGEKGVAKIRKFLAKNQEAMKQFETYRQDFDQYQEAMEAFFKLPGVTKLENGQFQYPSDLTPPVAPTAPFEDPNEIKTAGLDE